MKLMIATVLGIVVGTGVPNAGQEQFSSQQKDPAITLSKVLADRQTMKILCAR